METEKSQRRPTICTNVKEIRILQPSLIAKLMLRGHYAMVTRLAKKDFCVVSSVDKVNVNKEFYVVNVNKVNVNKANVNKVNENRVNVNHETEEVRNTPGKESEEVQRAPSKAKTEEVRNTPGKKETEEVQRAPSKTKTEEVRNTPGKKEAEEVQSTPGKTKTEEVQNTPSEAQAEEVEKAPRKSKNNAESKDAKGEDHIKTETEDHIKNESEDHIKTETEDENKPNEVNATQAQEWPREGATSEIKLKKKEKLNIEIIKAGKIKVDEYGLPVIEIENDLDKNDEESEDHEKKENDESKDPNNEDSAKLKNQWDPGISLSVNDKNTMVVFKVSEIKLMKLSDFCSLNPKMNQAVDAFGNPTANIVNVFTCAGCAQRQQFNGPYRWEHEFQHNPGNAQIRRDARHNVARWMPTFTLYTACQGCMETLYNIVLTMLNAP